MYEETLIKKASQLNELSPSSEILLLLNDFEQLGFDFLQAWTMDKPITPDRVILPSGRIFDQDELFIEDNVDLEILGAREFYKLVRYLDCDERQDKFPSSFLDYQDIKACEEKYISLNPT